MKQSKSQHILKTAVFLCLSVLSANSGQGAENQTTGTVFMASQPIFNGFVFVEGQYIEAPYVVSRRDQAIYINDRLIVVTLHHTCLVQLFVQ